MTGAGEPQTVEEMGLKILRGLLDVQQGFGYSVDCATDSLKSQAMHDLQDRGFISSHNLGAFPARTLDGTERWSAVRITARGRDAVKRIDGADETCLSGHELRGALHEGINQCGIAIGTIRIDGVSGDGNNILIGNQQVRQPTGRDVEDAKKAVNAAPVGKLKKAVLEWLPSALVSGLRKLIDTLQ